MGPELLTEIRDSPRTSWVPAANMMGMISAVEKVGGVELVEAMAESVTTKVSAHPLFRPLVHGALRLFGDGPGPLFKVLPRAWKVSNRDAGELETEVSSGRAVVRVSKLPPELECDPWKRSWRGTCHGMLALARVEGTVHPVELALGGFTVRVDWQD